MSAARARLYAVGDVLAMPPATDDHIMLIAHGAIEPGPVRHDIESRLAELHAERAPWLDAVLDLGAWVVGDALGIQIVTLTHEAPEAYDLRATNPDAIMPAIGAAVAAAFGEARPDRGVVVSARVTPSGYEWTALHEVADSCGRTQSVRLCSYDGAYEYMYRFPIVRLSRTPYASVAESIRAEWLAPAALAWTRDGLRFGANAARHYRDGYSVPPPAHAVDVDGVKRIARYSDVTAFAFLAAEIDARNGGLPLPGPATAGAEYARRSYVPFKAEFEWPDEPGYGDSVAL